MLPNLHDTAISARQRFRDEFVPNEVILSDNFKNVFRESLNTLNQSVEFTPHTAVVTTAGNLKMYIPNQWFCAAAYTTDFIQTFLQYKSLLYDVLENDHPSIRERSEYIKGLKGEEDTLVINHFRVSLIGLLQDHVENADVEETADLLIRFVTDYEWWFGQKTIDRGDSYVSPVLSLLGVVNVSQGYIAEISYRYATDQNLADAAHEMINTNPREPETEIGIDENIQENEQQRIANGINLIVYGAPGTGKSTYIERNFGQTNRVRTIFHPEYTVFDFIGSYKPFPIYREENGVLTTLDGEAVNTGEPVIDYRFVPGPFIKCLVNAWLNPAEMFTLIIEEINRAHAAAVFAEVFQLLDRDINGLSEFSISPSEDIYKYLSSIPGMNEYIEDGLRIPSNMNILATMNSADQGVMPMDSAFKRRWEFKYIRINIDGATHVGSPIRYAGTEVAWGNLVLGINNKLLSRGINEDRLIGPYFVRPFEIGRRSATDKLLIYLWDDVFRENRESFFLNQISTFSELSENFSEVDVFDLGENLPRRFLIEGLEEDTEEAEEVEDTDDEEVEDTENIE